MATEAATPTVSMPPDLLKAIDAAARDKKWNRSLVIREMAVTWLRMHGYPVSVGSDEPTEKAG